MGNKLYINVRDYQGGTWAMGRLETIRGWKETALQWCDSDENWELYESIKKHKSDEELIHIINDYWEIEIVPFSKDNIDKILDNYSADEHYWLLSDIISRFERRGW